MHLYHYILLLCNAGIAPLESGVMGTERRVTLRGKAQIQDGKLHVERVTVHKLFVPLSVLPAGGRKKALAMLKFLERFKTTDRKSVAIQAAKMITDMFTTDLVKKQIINNRWVLKRATSLQKEGCSVHSTVCAQTYVNRVFSLEKVPDDTSFKSLLKMTCNICTENELLKAIACEFLSRYRISFLSQFYHHVTFSYPRYTFMPRVVTHEASNQIKATSFVVLARAPFSFVVNLAKWRVLDSLQCTPFLHAAEFVLMSDIGIASRLCKDITRWGCLGFYVVMLLSAK